MGAVKIILRIVGTLMILLGVWWTAQGTGMAPVGEMANNMTWAYRGLALVAFGLIFLVLTRRAA